MMHPAGNQLTTTMLFHASIAVCGGVAELLMDGQMDGWNGGGTYKWINSSSHRDAKTE